jgi:DNA-binding response OmpR family regulator
MKIAILEPDFNELDSVKRALSACGCMCFGADSDTDLLSLFDSGIFDLALIDWAAPDAERGQTVYRLRERSTVPIVLSVVTATSDDDIVMGLSAGADLNIVKPLGSAVALARINALIRRALPHNAAASGPSVIENLRFRPGDHSVEKEGRKIRLSEREFSLALLLFRNLARPVSRRELSAVIWGDDAPSRTRSIDTYLSTIRSKLDLHPEAGYCLRAVYGYGYRLDRVTPP